MLQGLQRSLAKPAVKKLPVTAEMLAAIVEDAERSGSLADLRLATACVPSFPAFLRSDELVHIKAASTLKRISICLVKAYKRKGKVYRFRYNCM